MTAMLLDQMIVGEMEVCCYLLADAESGRGAVIDPGGDAAKILARCRELGIKPESIICTHGHPDHVCGNAALKAATGAEIIMHRADAEFFARPEVVNYFSMLGLPFSPPPDRLVSDGDTIAVGALSLEVIHTPGHTPGGICLYSPPHLFSGDTLFAGAVGRSDFPGGDLQQLLASIRERLLLLPPETVVWPGHGYGGHRSTIAEEARANPFLTGEW